MPRSKNRRRVPASKLSGQRTPAPLLATVKPSPGSGSRPLPTFASILRNAELNEAGDGKTITLDYEYFRNVLRAIVHQTPFDRELYLRRHPNLQNAERTGVISAAHAHWVYSGYLEGRTLFGWETFDFTPDEILKAPQSF